MSTRTFTGTINVFLTEYPSIGPNDMIEGNDAKVIRGLQFSPLDMTSAGWSKVGTAEVTVTIVSNDEIVANKVDALRKQQQTVRAEAEAKSQRIEEQIQSLLAITYTPEVQA